MKLKKIINSYPQRSSEEIIKKIQPYDIVSFDVFDTLIKRNVLDKNEVFDLVENAYNKRNNSHISGFKEFRLQAEDHVRTERKKQEVTIHDIYQYMSGKNIKSDKQNLVINNSVAEELMNLEVEMEISISQPNYKIKTVFEYCKRQKKKILIISDMYLSKIHVEKILKKNGYLGYDALYISCDYGVSKQDKGKLFNIVSEIEKIDKKDWIHIGDNKKADGIFANINGIKSVNIARNETNTNYIKNIQPRNLNLSILLAFINNNIVSIGNERHTKYQNSEDIYERKIGYEIYGPILYFFVKWLKDNVSPDKTILFFARDCYVVKQAYELMNGHNANRKYFLASRKSLLVPDLKNDPSLHHVLTLLKSDPKQFTVAFFCEKLGLKYDEIKEIALDYGFHPETVLDRDSLKDNKQFVKFYTKLIPYVTREATKAFTNFSTYFNSLHCTREIQVVDIGWRCTMQSCLQQLLPEYAFHGYYLGIREDANIIPQKDAIGFYLNGEDDAEKKCFLAESTALIEMFFSAPHGSVVSYSNGGGVNCSVYEGEENGENKNYIEHIQKGALKFVSEFSHFTLAEMISIDPEDIFLGLNQLNTNAKKSDLNKIGNFCFNSGVKNTPIAKPDHIFKYLFNPRKFVYDFSCSTWKVGFLKRLLKIKLPYHQMFSWIYEHR